MRDIPALVRQVIQANAEISKLEELLGKLKARRHMLTTVDLPEALTEFGSFVWGDERYSAKVEAKLYGSLPKEPEMHEHALDHVRFLGGEDIIKSEVSVAFPKGDIREARRIARIIASKTDLGVVVETSVHPMTLQAWARKMIEMNKPLNLDVLGLKSFNVATVKEKD